MWRERRRGRRRFDADFQRFITEVAWGIGLGTPRTWTGARAA